MFPCEAMLLISGKVGLRQTRYDSVLIKTSLCSLLSLYMPLLYAASGQEIATSLKDNLQGVFTPKNRMIILIK